MDRKDDLINFQSYDNLNYDKLEESKVIFFQLQKEDIERMDYMKLSTFYKSLANHEKGRNAFQKLILTVGGYDDIPDELYEIKAVRDYIEDIVIRFPLLPYFLMWEFPLAIELSDDTMRFPNSWFWVAMSNYQSLKLEGQETFPIHISIRHDLFERILKNIRTGGKLYKNNRKAQEIADIIKARFTPPIKKSL